MLKMSEERTASDPWRDFATNQNTGFCNSKQLLITMYAVLHFCTASWIARMRILSFVTSAYFFFFCLRFVTFLVAFYALFFGFCCRKHSLNSHTFFTQFNIFSYYNEFLKSICIVLFFWVRIWSETETETEIMFFLYFISPIRSVWTFCLRPSLLLYPKSYIRSCQGRVRGGQIGVEYIRHFRASLRRCFCLSNSLKMIWKGRSGEGSKIVCCLFYL